MSDPDAIGPDGTVGLRCYLPHADAHWFAADFAAAGLRDGRGQKPTAETARLT